MLGIGVVGYVTVIDGGACVVDSVDYVGAGVGVISGVVYCPLLFCSMVLVVLVLPLVLLVIVVLLLRLVLVLVLVMVRVLSLRVLL